MFEKIAKLLCLALCLAGMVGSVSAADFRILQIDGAPVKWGEAAFGKPAIVRYGFAVATHEQPDARNCKDIAGIAPLAKSAGVSVARVEAEADGAFAAWQAVAGIQFEKAKTPDDADILIGVQSKPRGYAYTNVTPSAPTNNKLATSKSGDRAMNIPDTPVPEAGQKAAAPISPIAKALICFNPEKRWKIGTGGDPEAYDLRYTFMHEIGHAIGLDHVGQRGFLMNFRYTEDFNGPQPGDIAGAQALYGAPQPKG